MTEAEPIPAPVEETALAPAINDGLSMWADKTVRSALWQSAQTLASSQLIPKHFQGKPEDCMVAMDFAQQLRVSPLTVLQNVYIVHGIPAFKSTFGITMANSRGPFKGNIGFRTTGEGASLAVTAHAVIEDTGECVEATVSMEMAKLEGWTGNKKYQTMPEQMLCYRSAMFLIRRYCPEVLLGFGMADEVEDVQAARSRGGREVPAQVDAIQELRDKVAVEVAEEAEVEPVIDAEPIADPTDALDAAAQDLQADAEPHPAEVVQETFVAQETKTDNDGFPVDAPF